MNHKFSLILSFFLLISPISASAQIPYIEEIRALGSIAGQGMACGSTKYQTYEMLARAVLLSKAPNNKLMNDGIYAYNEEKANAYLSKQMDGFYECALILQHFDSQDIFNITLYADGTLKMPDGKIIKPQTPYDASQLYSADSTEVAQAQKIYDKSAVKNAQKKIKSSVTSVKPDSRPRFNNAVLPPAIITQNGSEAATSAAPAAPTNKAPLPSNIKHISRNR